MPLWMAAFCFAVVCVTSGVDMSISRNGDCIEVFTTNNTSRCIFFQSNSELQGTNWRDFHGYISAPYENPVKRVSFSTKADTNRVFWRLRDCAIP